MKISLLLFALGLGWTATTLPASLVAQEETPQDTAIEPKSFELSLAPGVQLRDADSAIRILRLGIYNKNASVQGLDLGLINQTTEGISKGLQMGIVGLTEGDFVGWQASVVGIVKGEFNGLQTGALYNEINNGEAVQIGIFNRARDISGLQLGIVNWATNMEGIQIGLINIISGKESLQFLPIVNWSF